MSVARVIILWTSLKNLEKRQNHRYLERFCTCKGGKGRPILSEKHVTDGNILFDLATEREKD